MTQKLSKTLTTFRGTAILLNIVIGAGLLTLPGLAIKEAGPNAFYAWIICAIVAAPLLFIFILLGRLYPNAGGIAFYAQRALGSFGRRCAAFLLLGAIIFGLPSIALTRGHYLASVVPGSPFFYAVVLLIGSTLPHFIAGDGAGRAMSILASGVLVSVIIFLVIGYFGIGSTNASGVADTIDWRAALTPFGLIFFAFTGWEIGAGIAEEFINPHRDFPRAMALSFLIVTVLYLAVAYVAAYTDIVGHWEAPFVSFVQPALGQNGAIMVALIAAIIVFANLSGALWGVSRLVYSLARDFILPAALAKTTGGKPLRAVSLTASVLILVLILYRFELFSLEAMIDVAGQNFLILYGLAALSLYILTDNTLFRLLAGSVMAIVVGILSIQGIKLLYPIGLVALAILTNLYASSLREITKEN